MVCGSLKGTVVAILIWRFTAVQNQPSWSQKQSARNHSFPLFSELPSILRISYAKPWNLLHISDSDFSSTFVQNPQASNSDLSSNFSFDSPSFVISSSLWFQPSIFFLWFHLQASDLCFVTNLQASVSFSGFTLVQPFPQIRLTFIFNLNNPCSFG
jgi:hypothetical protein